MALVLGLIRTKILSNITKPYAVQTYKFSVLETETRKKFEKDFIYLRANQADYKKINETLWEAFYTDEPVSKALGLANKRPNPVLDDITTRVLTQGHSFVARCKHTGNIAGVGVNEMVAAFDAEISLKECKNILCPITRTVYEFWAYVQNKPDLYRKYNTDKIFELQSLAVLPKYRRKGIGYKLMETSRDYARRRGFRVIRTDATNIRTSRICKSLNMKPVYTIKLNEYLGSDNVPVIKVESPNDAIIVYIDDDFFKATMQKKP